MQAYITWLDPVTLSEVTKPRYGSVYPWPLNTVLTYLKVVTAIHIFDEKFVKTPIYVFIQSVTIL